jgi:hypothetical protein
LDGGIPKEAWINKYCKLLHFKRLSVMKHLSILIKKIEKKLNKNPRSVLLLDMELMIFVITYGIMKIKKLLRLYMSYSMISVMYTRSDCRGNK